MGKVIVVYGGGFQPFHAGHLSSYLQAKQKFGKLPNVEFYVTASNNTDTRPIPFKEKQWLAKQAGVSEQDFRNIVVKSPLNPVEILSQYNPDEDIFILVRSERDPVGYTKKDGSPGYYQPFVSLDKCVPFNSKTGGHGYVFVTHKEEFTIAGQTVYSGTQVRNMYANADDKLRNRIVHDMYPNSPNELSIRKVLDKYIGITDSESMAIKTSPVKKLKAKQLGERISLMRPLIKESTLERKLQFIKLMKIALSENKKYISEQEQLSTNITAQPNDDGDFDYYYKDEKIEKGTDIHNRIKDIHYQQKYPEYQALKGYIQNPQQNPLSSGPEIKPDKWPENNPNADKIVPPTYNIPSKVIKDIKGNPIRLRDYVPHDLDILENEIQNELNLFKKKKPIIEPEIEKEIETSSNDYHTYFKLATTDPEVYHSPQEFLDKKKVDVLASKGKTVKEFAPPEGSDNNNDRNRRLRKLLEIAIKVAEEQNVGTLGMVHAMNIIAGDDFFRVAVEGILPDITDREYTFIIQSAYKTVKQGNVTEVSDKTLQNYLSRADKQVSNRLSRMGQARERLNKNYEIYDVNNPTKIIDKFEANSPELAREYLYKIIGSYDPGDKDFHFEVRRSTGLSENRIIHSDTKVNLIIVVQGKPLLLNREPVPYNDETLKKYAVVAYMHLRDKYNKKYTINSIMRNIVVKPTEYEITENQDYLEEK